MFYVYLTPMQALMIAKVNYRRKTDETCETYLSRNSRQRIIFYVTNVLKNGVGP
jgi:hypothetical protein